MTKSKKKQSNLFVLVILFCLVVSASQLINLNRKVMTDIVLDLYMYDLISYETSEYLCYQLRK